ncbi:MAG: hypothetical protein ABIY55_24170 [Kofleriaceae bacterium]
MPATEAVRPLGIYPVRDIVSARDQAHWARKDIHMNTNVGQLATEWLSNEVWGIRPREERDLAAIAKAVIICAKGDRELSAAERNWMIGAYAARGVPATLIDELRAYEGQDDLATVLKGTGVEHAAPRVVIYMALQACAADGELHPLEVAAIVKMGGILGVSEAVVTQLKAVFEEERAVRAKRIKLAFPDGPPS